MVKCVWKEFRYQKGGECYEIHTKVFNSFGNKQYFTTYNHKLLKNGKNKELQNGSLFLNISLYKIFGESFIKYIPNFYKYNIPKG